ncbi:glycogen debranching protein GlgX [Silvimonas amylolytica]|uniref:Glycogen debranching enzyme n=1 Tax=Silvimonas amylolytica TaxID=449663 RepID=A0ABQ2PP13_9NEIS|nr:glycogen debranching protein GlgX [Silvimonas amylolytica]GGP26985.1 glycogen debranching enzyme [Silvimonas amylolytica]
MTLQDGRPFPLGATLGDDGINFALFSENATGVELCLFDANGVETRTPLPVCENNIWHGFLAGGHAGQVYGYRVSGRYAPREGHRFNPNKLLLDPYAKDVIGHAHDHSNFLGDDLENPGQPDPTDSQELAPKARVPGPDHYDWEGDKAPRVPWAQTVIYEAHVRGMTMQHPDVPENLRGTYAGFAHPSVIAHLKRLGVTTIELLPVTLHADEPRLQRMNLSNYWGYNPLALMAVESAYWSGREGTTPLSEFQDLVKALHKAGLEVIMDVVFNHTAELDDKGPTLSLRGIDNASYYHLASDGSYENWTGCGNTLKLSHPRMLQLMMDSLRYWVSTCHVDGFRFDLAPVLGRGPGGAYTTSAGPFAALAQDPVLAHVKLIAEPWDVGGGGYQLGHFPPGWAEWNDQYRDTLRRFWLHDGINRGQLAQRLAASSDLFSVPGRRPWASVNLITAHDGFTLADLTSYNQKHNKANGENNRDGHNENYAWNCGEEGPSEDEDVILLRTRSRRALLATLMLAQGTPMLLAGDELAHTQGGNNNAYCQNNATSWLDWAHADEDMITFVANLIALRKACPVLINGQWWQDTPSPDGQYDVQWLNPSGAALKSHDWDDSAARAMMLALRDGILILINGSAHQLEFRLPLGCWRVELASAEAKESGLHQGEYRASPRSVTVMMADTGPAKPADNTTQ